jgi:hypothetical protein
MAEPYNDGRHTPERYEDTMNPKNPPNSVANREVRRTALRSYLGPVIALFVVVGIALIYWANRGPVVADPADREVGTTGERQDVVGERGNADTPGGFNPDPRHDDTADELQYRGVDRNPEQLPGLRPGAALTGLAMLEGDPKDRIGRRIEIRDANVVDARDATNFSIQQGNAKVEVAAPRGGPAVKDGSKVSVSGVVEEDGNGGVRVRADRVDAN